MEVYRHYKGGFYNVIAMGKHTETEEDLVVYEDTNGKIWMRPVEMFHEEIEVQGKKVQRFEHVGSFYRN